MIKTSPLLHNLYLICVLPAIAQLLLGCEGDTANTINVNLSGSVHYEDKELDISGHTGNTKNQPVRHVFVDLVDVHGDMVATTTTDDNGNYSIAGRGPGLSLRIVAATSLAPGTMVRIADYDGNTYAVLKNIEQIDGDQTLNIVIETTSQIAGVYNMIDVFTSAVELTNSLSTQAMPVVNAYWEPQKSRYGTYFCPGDSTRGPCPQGKGMYILGGSARGGDTDEFDDDVLWHEFSHYIESYVGAQDSPGGSHYLTDNDSDLRLSWSEGWGGFFPTAVKHWVTNTNPGRLSIVDSVPLSQFIDTYGEFAGISIDLANPNPVFCASTRDCFVYASSEVAVAKVLTNLHNTFGMQVVWDVYSGYLPHGTSLPATLETFWDGWVNQRSPDSLELSMLRSIFNNRKIYYQQDSFESDDERSDAQQISLCFSTNCRGDLHYLYKAGGRDADLKAFNAVAGNSYRIETTDLSNGADTYLRILDSNGYVVFDIDGQQMTNNDRPGTQYCYTTDNPCRIHNDNTMLSSAVNFTPADSGTYFIEVTSNTNKPAAAGRYGTYSLRVTLSN